MPEQRFHADACFSPGAGRTPLGAPVSEWSCPVGCAIPLLGGITKSDPQIMTFMKSS